MSKATVILAALLLGIALGIIFDTGHGGLTEAADLIGTLWLNGLRMTVVPLVVALLITGIAQTAAAARAAWAARVVTASAHFAHYEPRDATRAEPVGVMQVMRIWCSG